MSPRLNGFVLFRLSDVPDVRFMSSSHGAKHLRVIIEDQK